MIQDIKQGRLENEFYLKTPSAEDVVLFYWNNKVMIRESECDLPLYSQVHSLFEGVPFIYLFRLGGRNYFMPLSFFCVETEGYGYYDVRQLYTLAPKELCFAAMTGKHLFYWYKNNRYCGCCGGITQHDSAERMLFCPDCKNMIYPRISPAVIVGVTRGDSLLLSRYALRAVKRYALIAGYTEIGETLEQTVMREVKEETGLEVCNIRYYKSQPWGVDGNILMGFFCDVTGDDTIRIDENELSEAGWFTREEIPSEDNGISLTEEMIRVFKNGEI